MASVGALGIGLSVVFGMFLVLLLAELYYLLFWKRKSLIASSRVTSASVVDPSATAGGGGGGDGPAFVTKMFESRGMGSEVGMIGLDGQDYVLAPPRLLFTIKEEGREDLVDSADDAAVLGSKSIRVKRPGHVVVELLPPPPPPDVPEVMDRGLLHVCSTSSEASGCSSSSSGDDGCSDRSAAVVTMVISPVAAGSIGEEIQELDGSLSSTTPFVTPPSSPAFSTPSSSPERPPLPPSTRRPALPPVPSPHLSYESPPSPPLQPMPLSSGDSHATAAMTPLSVSSSSTGRPSGGGRDSFSLNRSRPSP